MVSDSLTGNSLINGSEGSCTAVEKRFLRKEAKDRLTETVRAGCSLTGLSADEVRNRINEGKINVTSGDQRLTLSRIIRENVCTFFNLIFFLITISLCLVNAYQALTFLPVVISNILIGIVQEYRSAKALDRIKLMNAPLTKVIRGGKEIEISSKEIVLDDIVSFAGGDQLPADAVVLEGELLVNESLLTGEPDEILKQEGDILLSGSFAISGECLAGITSVGDDTYVAKMSAEAHRYRKQEQSEMIRSLDRLVKFIGIMIIPFGGLLMFTHYFVRNDSLGDSVTAACGAIIGMIPEGLYLLASVALAVSVLRLAKNSVLVHNMKSIESLARADILCVDKTGTITENTMEVQDCLPVFTSDGPAADARQLRGIAARFAAVMGQDSSTMKAMKETFRDVESASEDDERITPFSSVYKYSVARLDGQYYVLGAPEYLLPQNYGTYREQFDYWQQRGYRVVLLGTFPRRPEGRLTESVSPLGQILLHNPVRKNAPEIFRYFARQGVRIKVISGDSGMTASHIAMRAGIEGADAYLDAGDVSEEDLRLAAENFRIFGRVSPEQKRILIETMQGAGHTVAMTGDGVNDVLALRIADCSVALASGSDAAAYAAQMVLTDSDFARLPRVVDEGRRVVNNIQRTASLFLVKNIFSVLMTVAVILLRYRYPLQPSQVSLVGTFTIGLPAFFLALEENHDPIRGRFFSNVFAKALPAALTDFILILTLNYLAGIMQLSFNETSTISMIILALTGFILLVHVSLPMTVRHAVLCSAMVIGLAGGMFFFRNIVMTTLPGKNGLLILLAGAVLVFPLYYILGKLIKKCLIRSGFLQE